MSKINLLDSVARLRSSVLGDFDASQTAAWIQRYLTLSGRQVSFKGREYQARILSRQLL